MVPIALLRAALEMTRPPGVRVIGKGRPSATYGHRRRREGSHHQQSDASSHIASHLLSLFLQNETGQPLGSEKVAGCATGSARLLSAHLYESELLSLYLEFRLCSFPGTIMSVAVAARVCQVATFAVTWVLRACCCVANFAEFLFPDVE
jgi:hypothetical protein